MNKLIKKIFYLYKYEEVNNIGRASISFYKHQKPEIANYFIVYTIDCREFEDDEVQVLNALEQLEKDYAIKSDDSECTLKQSLINSFSNIQEASQIDKNTSAIYLIQFNNIDKLSNYRNAVYSIEESPNYFKRYVLPYTEDQVEQLNMALDQYGDRSILDALSQIVDSQENYFNLVKSKSLDSTYGLAIRMFSKLPFLQYKFKAELAPDPIEKQVEKKLSDEILKYHNILDKKELSIDEILLLEDNFSMEDETVDKELQKLLKGVK